MSMEINDGEFYLVKIPGSKTLHKTEEEAISHLKSNADDVNPESDDINIVRVSVEGEDWAIAEMSWQNIALQLMGE